MWTWWPKRMLLANGTSAFTLANRYVSRKERNPIWVSRESLANALDGEVVQEMVLALLVSLCYRTKQMLGPHWWMDARCATTRDKFNTLLGSLKTLLGSLKTLLAVSKLCWAVREQQFCRSVALDV